MIEISEDKWSSPLAQIPPYIEQLKVSLALQLGQVEITAARLAQLSPGEILEFQFDPQRSLALCVGEEKIAEARFVSHQGKFCLQIVSVEEL